jgi:hypothetical protein
MHGLQWDYSLAPNELYLVPKTKSALKGPRFQDTEDIYIYIKKKSDDSYSTTGFPKMFPTVAASLG